MLLLDFWISHDLHWDLVFIRFGFWQWGCRRLRVDCLNVFRTCYRNGLRFRFGGLRRTLLHVLQHAGVAVDARPGLLLLLELRESVCPELVIFAGEAVRNVPEYVCRQ